MSSVIEDPAPPGTSGEVYRKSKKSIKLVSCIVRTEKLDVVTHSLNKLNLVGGMTVTDVRGVGADKSEPELVRGPKYVAVFVPRVKIELVIETDDVSEVEKLVVELARTGEVGDGKVFVFTMIDVMRIRTTERGVSAL
jgi:nitrogen regulatory protein PII